MTITLNDQQAAGLAKVKAWYEGAGDASEFGMTEVFPWFGYAGTGKTFTAARIPEALGLQKVVFGTYTGKAASVLRRSLAKYGVGFPVSTIHSAIYFPTTSAAAKAALDLAKADLARMGDVQEVLDQMPQGDPRRIAYVVEQGWANVMEFSGHLDQTRESIPELTAAAKRLRWEFNPDSDWASVELIILDEVSMVNAKLAADIESYGVPIIVLGDPAQLPPVEGGGYYTNRKPQVLLTKIERQAIEGSPIIELATRVRESQGGALGLRPGDMRRRSLAEAMEADMVLTWTNKRRWAMINAMRKQHGRVAGQVVPGDTIMNLTNNKEMAVFNGQIFTVIEARKAVHKGVDLGWDLTVQDEDGNERPMSTHAEGFINQDEQTKAKNSGAGMRGNRILATYAQAITVHKAQGSEAKKVYVVNETPGLIGMTAKREGQDAALATARRWLYTAVTRASESVTITEPQTN